MNMGLPSVACIAIFSPASNLLAETPPSCTGRPPQSLQRAECHGRIFQRKEAEEINPCVPQGAIRQEELLRAMQTLAAGGSERMTEIGRFSSRRSRRTPIAARNG